MRIEGDKLRAISEYYTSAVAAAREVQENFRRYRAQYDGDNSIDGSLERASFVRNITYEIIETLVSTLIPDARVTEGIYSESNAKRAETVKRLCERLRDRLDIERINDITERDTMILGASVYLLEWDSRISTQRGVMGDVCISAIDPMDFFPQPDRARVCDMDYCFIRSRTTRRDISERYGVCAEVADELETAENRMQSDGETVEVITCYYYDELGRISKFVFSGETVLEDIPNYYARKREYCRVCGCDELECECEEPEFELIDGDEWETVDAKTLMDAGSDAATELCETDKVRIPWHLPRFLPIVIRTNITRSGSWYGQSDCEFIRPYQQEINKLESRIHSKIINSMVIPVLPADSEFKPDNSIGTRVLRLREGEDKGQYGVIDTSVDITRDMENADRVYDMARRAMGITDTFLGQSDDTAISGKAKEIQVRQSEGRMASKRMMKQVAFAEMDRMIFELYLAYADEPRPLSYVDAFGRVQNDAFNRYSFVKRDNITGEYYYDDDLLFSAESTEDIKAERTELANELIAKFPSGILGDPSDNTSVLRLWQSLEKLRHPLGSFNAEYFERKAVGEFKSNDPNDQKVSEASAEPSEYGGKKSVL